MTGTAAERRVWAAAGRSGAAAGRRVWAAAGRSE